MRGRAILVAVLFGLAVPATAQIGKQVTVRAGTPEDKALLEINAASDPAKKLELLDRFMVEYGKGDMALAAYDIYIADYLGAKEYDKAFEYGEKALALDPDAFSTGVTLLRAAQEKGDAARLFDYGERVGAMLQRYKAKPAPEGMDAGAWAQKKAQTLEDNQAKISYVEYTLFTSAYQTKDPAARAGLLERYVAAFPESPYTSNAQTVVADSYRQAREYSKMLDFAQKTLARDPANLGMLLLLSDYWSEQNEQLNKVEEYAEKALELLGEAKKPEQLTDEQWQQEKALEEGLARSARGQALVARGRDAQAVEDFRAARALLKANDFYYGRNLYRLGFTLAKMQRTAEARTVLTEAVAVNSPYRALAQEVLNKLGAAPRPAKRKP